MNSLFVIPAIPDPQRTPSSRTLRQGEIVRIEVLEPKADGRVLANVGKCRCLAGIGFPVQPGEVFWARVIESGQPLQLQLMTTHDDGRGAAAAASRAPIDHAEIGQALYRLANLRQSDNSEIQQLTQALAALYRHTQPLELPAASSQIAARINDFIENSGVWFEKRLANALAGFGDRIEAELPSRLKRLLSSDLKAALVRLKTMFEANSAALSVLRNDARSAVQHAVHSLMSDLLREQARLMSADSNPFLLFALPWQAAKAPIQLKWFLSGRRNRRQRDVFRLCLLLSLERLGDVRADLLLERDSLAVTFTVCDDRIKETLEPACKELIPRLNGRFDRVTVHVRVSAALREEFEGGCEKTLAFHDGHVDLLI